GNPNLHQAIQQRLAHWQEDEDLAALRDEKAPPEKERMAWQQLWADVAALRKKEGRRHATEGAFMLPLALLLSAFADVSPPSPPSDWRTSHPTTSSPAPVASCSCRARGPTTLPAAGASRPPALVTCCASCRSRRASRTRASTLPRPSSSRA